MLITKRFYKCTVIHNLLEHLEETGYRLLLTSRRHLHLTVEKSRGATHFNLPVSCEILILVIIDSV